MTGDDRTTAETPARTIFEDPLDINSWHDAHLETPPQLAGRKLFCRGGPKKLVVVPKVQASLSAARETDDAYTSRSIVSGGGRFNFGQ